MARVKRAVHSKKHRRATLERAKGYYGNKSRSYRAANEQVMHSLQYAYRTRPARNPRVQRARRLAHQRRARAEEHAFVIEGPHAVTAALDAGAVLETVFVEPAADRALVERIRAEVGPRLHELEPGTLGRISDA